MDWIKASFDCSISHAWRVLKERVNADIEQWLALTDTDGNVNVTEDGDRLLISMPGEFNGSGAWVTILKKENQLLVKTARHGNDPQVKEIRLHPTVNAEGQWRLRSGEAELEFWQASRLILEDVLFG